MSKLTTSMVAAKFISGAHLSRSTGELYSQRLHQFTMRCVYYENTMVNEAMAKWIGDMITANRSRHTITCYYKTVGTMVRWLNEDPDMPQIRLRPVKLTVPMPAQREVFTDAELKLLDTEADPQWRAIIALGWQAGLRLGDAACLRRENLHLGVTSFIRYTPAKTRAMGKILEVPISGGLASLVLGAAQSDDRLFPDMCSAYAVYRGSRLSRAFVDRCEKLGIKGKTFHCLRHTFVTRLLKGGVSPAIVAEMTGHSLRQLMGYCHIPIESKVMAIGAHLTL